jgi:hypothetical protein
MAKRKFIAAKVLPSIPEINAPGMSGDDPTPLDERTRRLASLARIWIEQERQDQAATLADSKRKFEGKGISPADIKTVRDRVGEIADAVNAIHGVAWRAIDDGPEEREQALTLIFEAARSAVRALDACQVKLGGAPMGNFSDDLATH